MGDPNPTELTREFLRARRRRRFRLACRFIETLALVLALAASTIALLKQVLINRTANDAAAKATAASSTASKALDQATAATVSGRLTILLPTPSEVITENPYLKMHGGLSGDLPAGYTLWVLGRSTPNYFLMNPPAQVVVTKGEWFQDNVRLATPGPWRLFVCLANAQATEWFRARASASDWRGFEQLPDGAAILQMVDVTKAASATAVRPMVTPPPPTAPASVGATITSPKEGGVVAALPYDGMAGTLEAPLPAGRSLRVLARDSYNYFLMNPPTQVVADTKAWTQTNIRLATPGNWELLLCLVDDKAAKWLDDRAAKEDWSGFSTPPPGLEILRTVHVTRE